MGGEDNHGLVGSAEHANVVPTKRKKVAKGQLMSGKFNDPNDWLANHSRGDQCDTKGRPKPRIVQNGMSDLHKIYKHNVN